MSKNSVTKILSLALLVGFIAVVPGFATGIEIEPDGLTGIEIEPDGWRSGPRLPETHSPHSARRARYSAADEGRFEAS